MTMKASLAGSLEAGIVLAVAVAGCGQDVATCDTICGFSDAPQPTSTCVNQCTTTQQACANATPSAAGDFQAYLTCIANSGSYQVVGGTCEPQVATVAKLCGSVMSTPDGGTTSDSGVPIKNCALGAACSTVGAGCTIAGAGPCGSNQRLLCAATGSLVADGFPCVAGDASTCGWAETTPTVCAESCSCVSGLEVCTGDCPDAGPAKP